MERPRPLIVPPAPVPEILRALAHSNLQAYLVGGAVRDALLNLHPKDFDIEVYGISYEDLAKFLSAYGRVDLVGKSFGVVKLFNTSQQAIDFSIPRREASETPFNACIRFAVFNKRRSQI